jgi:hypothetical protein
MFAFAKIRARRSAPENELSEERRRIRRRYLRLQSESLADTGNAPTPRLVDASDRRAASQESPLMRPFPPKATRRSM